MKPIILYLFLFFPFVHMFCQCDSIVLFSQSDINNFIKNHGKCETIRYLIIKDSKKDIFNFDSLLSIKRVTQRLEIRQRNDLKSNVLGFRNLSFVNELHLFELNSEDSFAALDTINQLEFGSDFLNLKSIIALRNVKHIHSSLFLTAKCDNKETPYFTTGPDFFLSLNGFMDSNSVKVIASRIKNENFKGLTIFPGDGFDLKNIPNIDSVKVLRFGYCKSSDFSTISKLKKVEYFLLQDDLGNNKYGDGFVDINKLKALNFQNNKSYVDGKKLLPNLRSIEEYFLMINNDSIFDLKFLENARPPRSRYLGLYKVHIQNNKRLRDCNVSFLCEALKLYPDSVLISGNGGKCTKDDILAYCNRVSTQQKATDEIVIAPNPAFEVLRVTGIDGEFNYRVKTLNGNEVLIGKTSELIPITNLYPGIYILEINIGTDVRRNIVRKIVKM